MVCSWGLKVINGMDGEDEKKPPGLPAVGLFGSLLAYARLPLKPPVRGENQKYAKKNRE
jgi:hypothetical protein